jgi:hypothetical protein
MELVPPKRKEDLVNRTRRTSTARLFGAAALVVAVVIAGTPAGAADEGGAKQYIRAYNQHDASALVRSGVQVSPTGSDTAAPENLALATASCTDCRTVAVAVQAVLITRPASVITPKNVAWAANSGCNGCETMAAAYQCVVTTTKPVQIGPEGERKISTLRSDIAAAAASGQDFTTIEARIDSLVDELWAVIDSALAAANEARRCNPHKQQMT